MNVRRAIGIVLAYLLMWAYAAFVLYQWLFGDATNSRIIATW